MTADVQLPHQGEHYRASDRRHSEVVVFVHHYGGNKTHLRKHIAFVNQLGFDAVAFNLSHNEPKPWRWPTLPVSSDFKFGIRHIWTEEIEQIFNMIPENKIVYSFSFPSACAAEAMGRRKCVDIKAWICDSGPFFELYRCSWNLFTHNYRINNPLLRAAMTASSFFVWGNRNYEKDIGAALKAFPADFPVLSIRGWQDRLVPMSAIEAVFKGQDHLALEVLSLPEAPHIQGLIRSPDEYKPRVAGFLSS